MMVTCGNLPVGFPGFLFRRDDWERKGGLDVGLRVGSDYDFASWLCMQGKVVFVPQILFLRRMRGGLSVSTMDGWVELVRVLLRYAPIAKTSAANAEKYRSRLRTHFLWILVGAGLAGRHGEAFTMLGAVIRDWGLSPDAALTAAKLLFTYFGPWFSRHQHHFPAGKVGEFVHELRTLMALC